MRWSAAVLATCIAALFPAAAGAPPLSAGRWHSQGVITTAELPGMPARALDAMKRRPLSHEYCLTADDAAKGARGLFSEGNGSCHYTKFKMSGGRIDAVLACAGPQGSTRMTMRGRYSATKYETTNVLVMAGPHGAMRMTTKMTGRRTGAC